MKLNYINLEKKSIKEEMMNNLIHYKKAPKEVKEKVKYIRKKFLSHRKFWEKPFVFQLRKIFLRFNGIQKGGKDIYFMWTIIYNKKPIHRNNTTIAVKNK